MLEVILMRIIRSRLNVSLPFGMDRRGVGMQEFGVCLGWLAVTVWFAVMN